MLIYRTSQRTNMRRKRSEKMEMSEKGKRREQGRNLTDNKWETIDNIKMKIKIIKIWEKEKCMRKKENKQAR